MNPVPSFLKENVSLKPHSWFGVGGSSKFYAKLSSFDQFYDLVEWNSKTYNLPVKCIGIGANVLFSDDGFDGIIVTLPATNISHEYHDQKRDFLIVDAGVTMDTAIDYALENLLFGLEEFSGIPSSIGGALFINLHYYEFLISQFVYSAKVYDTKEKKIKTVLNEWFEFGYDTSKIKTSSQYIVLQATFLLEKNNELYREYAKGRRKEIIRHRYSRYPYQRTCGCFFKNFSADEVPELNGRRTKAASFYIDQCGLRGVLKVGDTFLSNQHANMITHKGSGTASEIISIARKMQEEVFKKYGLLLEPECELIGFFEYPLYTKDTISQKGLS